MSYIYIYIYDISRLRVNLLTELNYIKNSAVKRHFWAPSDFGRHQYFPSHTLLLSLRRLYHPAKDSNSVFLT